MSEAPEFEAHVRICMAIVCSKSDDIEAITERLNREHPTGISSAWALRDISELEDGSPHPAKCLEHPDTNKHYVFEC